MIIDDTKKGRKFTPMFFILVLLIILINSITIYRMLRSAQAEENAYRQIEEASCCDSTDCKAHNGTLLVVVSYDLPLFRSTG